MYLYGPLFIFIDLSRLTRLLFRSVFDFDLLSIEMALNSCINFENYFIAARAAKEHSD